MSDSAVSKDWVPGRSPPVSQWKKWLRAALPVPRKSFEAERAARLAAEAAGARLALFADATKALTSSFDLNVVLHDLARLVAPAFADACLIDLIEPDGSIRRAATAVAPAHESWAAGLEALCPPARLHETTAREALSSRLPQVINEAGYSAVVVPLKGRPGSLGVLWLVQAGPGAGPATIDLAEELARRASIAVENARLFDRQRTVSETLQQSLLPERLPDIPGMATAARYLPGGPDVDIGGDWYDVMQLPGAGIGLALGDVVGRGERAAALMGQLRNAVRAYAFEGRSPAQVMERVNGLLLESGSDYMATMIFGVLDAETGNFCYVNAGHPPPLLLSPENEARFLESGHGPPVGSLPTARYTETNAELSPGSTLLLYTDGLVEDRTTPLDEGLSRLSEAAVEGPGEDLEGFCSHVMRCVIGTTPCNDDVALLAVQLVPLGDRLHLRVPAQPGALAPLRATLRRWLVRAGASELETYELLTACGEACTNAIRHASGPLRTDFEVEATIVEGGVEVSVRDQGSWRERRGDVGGRGLPIIEAYVDELTITPSPSGTEVRMRRRLSADGELVR
jgi:serine phosphatase RsbU (regulator of sigma subunit)/anti-sigma regulatory factor (Ser/Thr protein kinase)